MRSFVPITTKSVYAEETRSTALKIRPAKVTFRRKKERRKGRFESLVVLALNQAFLGFDPTYPEPFFARKTILIPVSRKTSKKTAKK